MSQTQTTSRKTGGFKTSESSKRTKPLKAVPKAKAELARAIQPARALPVAGVTTEKAERFARLLLRAIQTEMSSAGFVTREDLLQVRVLQHVSTITRYAEVCGAVQVLLRRGLLIAVSRTDLVLPEKAATYQKDSPLADQYSTTIRKLCRTQKKGTAFSVMDIVFEWRTDQHLTINNKRVAVRGVLKRMAHEGVIKVTDDFEYTLA